MENTPKKKKQKICYPISDHYDGKIFFNPGKGPIKKNFQSLFKMLAGARGTEKWPAYVKNEAKPQLANSLSLDETYITYINHASHLIQLQDLNILTDPIFTQRAGPASLVGPKRVCKPGLALEDLPPIHVVLISHNHFDHMCLPSLVRLRKLFNPLYIVPLGNQKYLKRKKFEKIIELDWWQCHHLNEEQSITLVPAVHWSMRTMRDRNKALWGGFWIKCKDLKIYFAGDTGYDNHFKQIRQCLSSPDISILPIGSYEPSWFMKQQHMDPEEAVLASLDLQSTLSIATHHRTFRLSYEGYDEPLNALKTSLLRHGIREKDFIAPENGETTIFSLQNL